MLTFQDFEKVTDIPEFISQAIAEHLKSDKYKIAISADKYDHQLNETIYNYVKLMFDVLGTPLIDFTASNNKIASNFFHRLNTQRCEYLLGNGVSFTDNVIETMTEDGNIQTVDQTKEYFGKKFDSDLKKVVYGGLIHGESYGYWVENGGNKNRLKVFTVPEFVPLVDEETGELRAGIRFWQIDNTKPMFVVLYEADGFTTFKGENGYSSLKEIRGKEKYIKTIVSSEFDGDQIVDENNYPMLPIITFYGSSLKQSTLVGMRNGIDSYDLIRSGFANDLSDCAQVYWLLENCTGMSDAELERFRDRLKFNHIAVADTDESKVTPYAQEIPYQARKEYLDHMRAGIYEDFGGLDVHTVAAGATNDHIDAAYQPLDEEADDLEYQVGEFLEKLLNLVGIEDSPVFKRNRISNEKETTEMILSAADYLDDETILNKLPFITVDEIYKILRNKDQENSDRFGNDIGNADNEDNDDTIEE